MINYHFVWIPKRRKAVLVGAIERDLRRLLEQNAEELDCRILALEIMPDHVHLFINCPPTLAPDQVMFRLKGSSRIPCGNAALNCCAFLHLDPLLFCSTAGNVSNATRGILRNRKTKTEFIRRLKPWVFLGSFYNQPNSPPSAYVSPTGGRDFLPANLKSRFRPVRVEPAVVGTIDT
jgi:putative transposase